MKGLLKDSAFVAVLLLGIAANSVALAQSFDELVPQRFLWQGTFGLELSPPNPGATHRIVSYLPHSSLVFYHPKLINTKQIGSSEYRAVVTQFGQELWVLDSEVSNTTSFKKVYGTQNVIFNQDGFMCPTENKICDEVSGQEINRGSVLETVAAGPDFYHLRLKEGFGEGENRVNRTRDGYLPIAQFNEFERLGVLTDARKQHPAALLVSTKKLDVLSTRCGEVWSEQKLSDVSEQLNVQTGFDFLGFFATALGITATKTTTNTIKATFGGPGIAMERIEVVIKQPDSNGNFSSQPDQALYLSLEIKCIGSQNDQEAVHIRSLTVRNKDGYLGQIASADIYNLPDGVKTPSDDALSLVYSKNGRRPFLVSISSRDEYRSTIGVLMDKINDIDISLANILLSELNASCNNRLVGNQTHRQTCTRALPSLR